MFINTNTHLATFPQQPYLNASKYQSAQARDTPVHWMLHSGENNQFKCIFKGDV